MKILSIFGTRPEAVKMAPVVHALNQSKRISHKVCVTAQHREMLDSVLKIFDIQPDFDLNIMKTAQSLEQITASILHELSVVLKQEKPDRILVHGDTATTFTASLAAFYQKIPIGHVEAGLRTQNLYSPWPEEGNRKLTSALADLHFAPTDTTRQNLLLENIAKDRIHVTGNTVIDAILWARQKIDTSPDLKTRLNQSLPPLSNGKRQILITGHRRENFGGGLQQICEAIRTLAQDSSLQIIYPVHLNPQVQKPVYSLLDGLDNVHLLPPQDYLPFVELLGRTHILLTDSGGLQEEAPALGIPTLLMRETTERPEAIEAGTVKMVGTDARRLVSETRHLLENPDAWQKMADSINPYGNGDASQKILLALENE